MKLVEFCCIYWLLQIKNTEPQVIICKILIRKVHCVLYLSYFQTSTRHFSLVIKHTWFWLNIVRFISYRVPICGMIYSILTNAKIMNYKQLYSFASGSHFHTKKKFHYIWKNPRELSEYIPSSYLSHEKIFQFNDIENRYMKSWL